MDATVSEWGCCSINDKNEKFLQCDLCKKAFHYKCLNLDYTSKKTAWTCPICDSKTPKTKNNDNTPVRFNPNITVRSKKRPALESPPGATIASITEDSVRTIIKEEMNRQADTLIEKITLSMKNMLSNELKSMREEIKDIRDSVSFISLQYEDIVKESKKDKEIIRNLEEQNKSITSNLKEFTVRLNNLEQQTRANNLEIQCVPQKKK